MKNKVVLVTSLNLIAKLKDKGIKYFAYPLTFFCVGIAKTFDLKDIKEDEAFLFINRVLNSQDINKLKDILEHLPSNIKGVIFEDLGLIPILKDKPLEKILYNMHHQTNYRSINSYLRYVDSLVVSCDITYEEIKEITLKADKKVSLFVFGPVSSMYSRRTLLSSYARHYGLSYTNIKNLKVNNEKFMALENEYGTVLYHMPYFNGLRLLALEAKYYFYMPLMMEDDDILALVDGQVNVFCDEGFLDKKTIYKVKNR